MSVQNDRPMVSAADLEAFDKIESLFGSHSIASRRWDVVEQAVKLCARNIWVMTQLPLIELTRPGDVPVDTINRFYNETVGFILTGKRQIRPKVFTGIIRAMSEDFYPKFQSQGTRDSLGARRLQPAPSLRVTHMTSLGSPKPSTELLSYAHHQILHRWLTQENGLDDMVVTLGALARTYNVYNY